MALSIAYWANYVNGQKKLTRKSEAAVESDRMLSFFFDQELRVINSSEQASMRDTSYKVQVSALLPRLCSSKYWHLVIQLNVLISRNILHAIN